MIRNERNVRVDGSMVPSSSKALFLKTAILLPVIVIKTIAMFLSVQVLVSQKYIEEKVSKKAD